MARKGFTAKVPRRKHLKEVRASYEAVAGKAF